MVYPPRPSREYGFLDAELKAKDADAYVHIGDCYDEQLRYLTLFAGPDRDCAFVYADNTATLCAPDRFGEQAEREFPGDKVDMTNAAERPPAEERAQTVLDNHGSVDRILLPEVSKFTTVEMFREFGYEVKLTEVVHEGRITKGEDEHVVQRHVELIAQRGMARAETVLASADIDGKTLIWNDETLTTETLRREINAELAKHGITDYGNTVVGAGESCADLHFNGTDTINPHETVLIDIGPRGPYGYYGDISRTFVPGSVGDWERETYDIVNQAFEAGIKAIEDGAGVPASAIQDNIEDVLNEHGYKLGDVDVGMYHGSGHGIGVCIHERPFLSTDEVIQPNTILTIEPGIYDAENGGVRLEDVILVTEGGYENFVSYPKQIRPEERSI